MNRPSIPALQVGLREGKEWYKATQLVSEKARIRSSWSDPKPFPSGVQSFWMKTSRSHSLWNPGKQVLHPPSSIEHNR